MWRCNDELRVRADEMHHSAKKDEVAKHYIGRHEKIWEMCCAFLQNENLNMMSLNKLL